MADSKDSKEAKKKARKAGFQKRLFLVCGLILSIVMLPTAIVMFFGMLPTIVIAVADRSKTGSSAMTVGSMNLAGCTPFLFELWEKGHTPDLAFGIVGDPRTIIVIYCAAAIGYLINWAMSGITVIVLIQKAKGRMKEIEARQEALKERWGPEVSGDMPLNRWGFPVEQAEGEEEE